MSTETRRCKQKGGNRLGRSLLCPQSCLCAWWMMYVWGCYYVVDWTFLRVYL